MRGDSGLLDVTDSFQSYVDLAEQHLGGLKNLCTVDQMIVLGSAGPHTLTVTTHRDYGCEPRSDDVLMSAETGDQTRAQHVLEAAFHADAKSIGMRIGDICPTALPWNIDAVIIQYEPRQDIAG